MHDKHFDSVADIEKVRPSSNNAKAWNSTVRGYHSGGNRSWFGVGSVQEVKNATSKGWPKGLKRIRESIKALVPRGVATIRRRRIRSDFGDHLDMQAVYSGNLDRAWGTTERRVQRGLGRTVTTLLVNIGGLAHLSSEALFWKGAAAVALADALEKSGRSVRIVAFSSARGVYLKYGFEHKLTTITVEVKAPNMPLDCQRLATVSALAGFFRFYIFRARHDAPDHVDSGLGSTVRFTQEDVAEGNLPDELKKHCECEPTILVDKIFNVREAQAFVDSWCERFNGN